MTLVGRAAELGALGALLAPGSAAVVLVTGEAWVGKSALVRAALDASGRHAARGIAEREGAARYAPLAGALRDLLHHGASVPAQLAPTLGAVLPELVPASASAPAPADAGLLAEAVRSLVAQSGPVALVFDDLQWTDAQTAAVLASLARTLEHAAVPLVLVARVDDTASGHPLRRLRSELRRDGRLQEIEVAPLGPEAVAALVGREGAADPAVAERAGGIPFLVSELARAGGALPERVRDAVLLRAEALAADDRRALAVAALAGATFDPALVATAAGLDAWPPALDGWTHPAGEGRRIRQEVVRAVLAEGLAPDARRASHAALAAALDSVDAPAAVTQWTAALALWPAGGGDDGERLRALARLARSAEPAGDAPAAASAWRELADAHASAGAAAAAAEAHRRLAGALELQGRWVEAIAAREQAAAAFAVVARPADAAAERLAAAAHLRSAASHRAALDLLDLAAADAREAGRPDLVVRVQALEGNVRARMGEAEVGVALVRTALADALGADQTVAAAEVYQRLADSLEHGSDYAAAKATYDDAIGFCTTTGAEPLATVCLACLAVVLRQTGDWERACRVCREVLAMPHTLPHPRAAAATTLGTILALRGDTSHARALLLEGVTVGRRIELLPAELLATWGLAVLDEVEGHEAAAADACTALLERWEQTEERHYAIGPLRWAATLFARLADPDGVARCAAALARIAADVGGPEAGSALSHAIAEAALLAGEPDRAITQFERALALLQEIGAPLERIETERRLAAALVVAGRGDAAVEHLLSAYRAARRLKAQPIVKRLAATLAELGEQVDARVTRRQAEQLGREDLTRRELEILAAVAAGRTNREIAADLVLSTRTVDMHVRNILRKLGCRSRTDAARAAAERGFVTAAKTR